MRVVVSDTSDPMATNYGDVVSAEAGKKVAAWGPSTSCRVLHDDDELLQVALVAVLDCLTAEPSSLGTQPTRLVDLGVFVDVDRQA